MCADSFRRSRRFCRPTAVFSRATEAVFSQRSARLVWVCDAPHTPGARHGHLDLDDEQSVSARSQFEGRQTVQMCRLLGFAENSPRGLVSRVLRVAPGDSPCSQYTRRRRLHNSRTLAASNELRLSEKIAKITKKVDAIAVYGARLSRSCHRSVGYCRSCGRRRSRTRLTTVTVLLRANRVAFSPV